jgi:sulfotransferase family protein
VPSREPTWSLWRRLRRRFLHQAFVDLGHDPTKAVLVAGSARSGTTWLADMVNHGNRYRYIFEPFRPDRLAVRGSLAARPYARPGTPDPELEAAAQAILAGRIRSSWTDRSNRKLIARRRLIKDVWANMLLPWVRERFPELRIVFLLRHPFAVVHSQIVLESWDWQIDPEDLLGQPMLVNDIIGPYEDEIRSAATPFERHLVVWCVENLVPLRLMAPGDAHVVYYEDLCVRPAGVLDPLFRYLGERLEPSTLPALLRPSFAVRAGSAVLVGDGLVDAWSRSISPSDVRRGLEILERFGLDVVYSEDPLPRVPADRLLHRMAVDGSRTLDG